MHAHTKQGKVVKDDVFTPHQVWDLADITRSGKLSETEFCIAMHLVASAMKGIELPAALPLDLKNLNLSLLRPVLLLSISTYQLAYA